MVSRFLLTQLSYECINNVFLVFSSSHSVLENLIDTDNFLILNMGVRITEVISQPCSNYVLFFFGLGIIKNKEAFEKHPALISFSFYCWKKKHKPLQWGWSFQILPLMRKVGVVFCIHHSPYFCSLTW